MSEQNSPRLSGAPSHLWAIVPFLDLPEMTADAIDDLLAQRGASVRVLAISNPSSPDTRRQMEARAREEAWRGRVHFWWHHPPLETLDATWNAALDFAWATGAQSALVVNNDVRLTPWTAETLLQVQALSGALFVSAVGVREKEFQEYLSAGASEVGDSRGGPDFSCFLITRECHERYPFDEAFTFRGDNDHHRRIMLGGDAKRIFSVNVPYLHFGSQTLKRVRSAQIHHDAVMDGQRFYYTQKWGGDVNGERYRVPFDPGSAEEGITNPELQARG